MNYSHWIWTEFKESKLFTILNIAGVWLNILFVLVFLALALGIEQATITQITKNINLYTIEVSARNSKDLLSISQFQSFSPQTNSQVQQIIPVNTAFADLKTYSANTSNNDLSITSEPIASVNIYTESYFNEGEVNEDLRVSYLKFVLGKKPNNQNTDGIIISQDVFNKIFKNNSTSKDMAVKGQNLVLEVRRDNKVQRFPCKIAGVVEKTNYNNILVYVTSPLAAKMSYWLNDFEQSIPADYQSRQYERIDILAKNLDDLSNIRTQLSEQGYRTSSVLDRIEGVKRIINLSKIIFLLIIGISALIAGFNLVITLTSYVLKRQREIGILKALGATDWQIQIIFILHSVYLCLLGSILGAGTSYIVITLGNLILSTVEIYKEITLFKLSFTDVMMVILTCLFLGVIAALIPAKKAASISPIETMRST